MTSPVDIIEHDGTKPPFMFARLTPRNEDAHRAFSTVVDVILQHGSRFAHHRKFMSFSTTEVPLISQWRGASLSTTTDTDPEPNHDDLQPAESKQEMIWSGYYLFSLSNAPNLPAAGWRAGSGKWTTPQGGVDFLLSYNMPYTRVRGSHVSFTFDKSSGVLVLQARHHGHKGMRFNADYIGRNDGPRALNRPTSVVQVGNLEYEFSYAVEPNTAMEIAFQAEKVKYFRDYLNAPPPIEATSATPSVTDITLGSWTLHAALGRGTYGVVTAATHCCGDVVAFKTFLRHNRMSDSNVRAEILAVQRLKPVLEAHEYGKYVLQIKDVIYQRGRPEFDNGAPEHVYLLYTPLARATFHSYIIGERTDALPGEIKIALFKQVLQGLVSLHSNGWVHRDIKPTNLGVVSLEPPRAVILDLGQVCYLEPTEDSRPDIKPRPGQIGTIWYLAPEMEFSPYDEKVDIWALGIIAHELKFGFHPWKTSVNPWNEQCPEHQQVLDAYARTLRNLNVADQHSFEYLILEMLNWDPDKRPSAEDALRHHAMRTVVASGMTAGVRAGIKRQLE